MSIPQAIKGLPGNWTGTSRLYLSWLPAPDSESASPSVATVALTARDKFMTIEYTWAFEGKPQQGFILFGAEGEGNAATAAWVDSWHMSDKPMFSKGRVDDAGAVDVLGSYAAPPGPDWGWRTVIAPGGSDAFELVMYNISPEGEETLAFRNSYERRP